MLTPIATQDDVQYKNVVIIFTHGEALLVEICKVSKSLSATIYPIGLNTGKHVNCQVPL